MHGSREFIINNHLTLRAELEVIINPKCCSSHVPDWLLLYMQYAPGSSCSALEVLGMA